MAIESLRVPAAANHCREDLTLEVGQGPTEQHVEIKVYDEDVLEARLVVEIQDILTALRVLRVMPLGGS